MKASRLASLAGVLAMGVVAAACGSSASSSSGSSGSSSSAGAAPAQITIGTTYSGSGSFAVSSLAELGGLKFWISHENGKGGVYVGAYKKRIPVKLVAYNDQSDPATAGVLTNQLITQNHVNILTADFGSVLTAPAVSIAQAHHMVLFDQSGTGIPFFTPSNPYIVLCNLPVSSIWPTVLSNFLIAKHINNVAILYGTNDFDASQATTLQSKLTKAGIKVAYYQGIPTSTTSYGTLLNTIHATNPGAVLELGYQPNDVAFLQAVQSSGLHFPMVFTVFPGQLLSLFQQDVGTQGLAYTYTYATNYFHNYTSVNEGMTTSQFLTQIAKAAPQANNTVGLLGYNTGLVIQAVLKQAKSLSQTDIRAAATAVSGHLNTLDGNFVINSEGAQIGELLPLGQLVPSSGSAAMKVVYPSSQAQAQAVYPMP
ncbi:MAG: ABC transporter substrate-binding protein [Actinomycetota bacterium]|nr:ABC transporter substrate-binding protein [Actinomycetota bacterium]